MNPIILVAAHKPYRMPDDPLYLPVHAGKALSNQDLGFQGDNTGDNISEKNPYFCELTVIYWGWKNLPETVDAVGLCHYRRYFRGHRGKDKWESILRQKEAEKLLEAAPVLVPRPRRYYIETNYSHYIHAHPAEGLDLAFAYAAESGSGYAAAVETVKNRTWAHMFNMFLMRRKQFDAYCAWLFPILFRMEKNLDISSWRAYDKRVYGFAAERLLDVWLEANKIPYREIPAMFMEKQNWLKKGGAFLKRKFFGRPE